MKCVKAAIGFALGTCVALALAWVSGFNFDHRGPDTFAVSVVTLYAGGISAVIALTFWKKSP